MRRTPAPRPAGLRAGCGPPRRAAGLGAGCGARGGGAARPLGWGRCSRGVASALWPALGPVRNAPGTRCPYRDAPVRLGGASAGRAPPRRCAGRSELSTEIGGRGAGAIRTMGAGGAGAMHRGESTGIAPAPGRDRSLRGPERASGVRAPCRRPRETGRGERWRASAAVTAGRSELSTAIGERRAAGGGRRAAGGGRGIMVGCDASCGRDHDHWGWRRGRDAWGKWTGIAPAPRLFGCCVVRNAPAASGAPAIPDPSQGVRFAAPERTSLSSARAGAPGRAGAHRGPANIR
jgi:hypothetical protein